MDYMSPWDAMAYFRLPRVTVKTPVGGAWTALVNADPQRVAIIFASGTVTGAVPVIQVTSDSTVALNAGIPVWGRSVPIDFNVHDHGNLPQVAWFVVGDGASTIHVIEIVMQAWPRPPSKRVARQMPLPPDLAAKATILGRTDPRGRIGE